jgi:hypothetical protein
MKIFLDFSSLSLSLTLSLSLSMLEAAAGLKPFTLETEASALTLCFTTASPTKALVLSYQVMLISCKIFEPLGFTSFT